MPISCLILGFTVFEISPYTRLFHSALSASRPWNMLNYLDYFNSGVLMKGSLRTPELSI